jgi:hypothetical protein
MRGRGCDKGGVIPLAQVQTHSAFDNISLCRVLIYRLDTAYLSSMFVPNEIR